MPMEPNLFCERMEQFDDDVYASARSQFETLMFMMRDNFINGNIEKGNEQMATLLEAYNNASYGCQRMVGRARRLENGLK